MESSMYKYAQGFEDLHLLNLKKQIRVRTVVGESDEKDTGENIGQGTLEGAVIGAADIDYTMNRLFSEKIIEMLINI